jgi:hypothetical protein
MKLSKLRSLCDKAIEKYGDIGLGVYSACDSYDVTDGSEAFQDLSFRVVHDQELPGESLEEEEQSIKQSEPTAVLFYS